MDMTRRNLLASALGAAACHGFAAEQDGFVPLFDGRSLAGWTPNENSASWKIVDGQLAADGPRSHLFYTGPHGTAPFRNFELEVEFLTRPKANSGVYFHTRPQPAGWPNAGLEVQVNSTAEGEGNYRERKKVGSLYGLRNVYKAFARDDEWNMLQVTVRRPQVQIRLNGILLVDYVEPAFAERKLGEGTFALQCHDPGSKAFYRKIAVRRLPDNAQPINPYIPEDDAVARTLLQMGVNNYPVVDFHTHLKGITLEQVLEHGRRTGIMHGVAVNCGHGFPVHSDAGVREFIQSIGNAPVFVAIQGEGREWPAMVSRETLARVDYTFTDAMTFTDDRGKRMRLWIRDEVGAIENPQKFADLYVDKIIGVMRDEPIDIYANPTFLPAVIEDRYDELWTVERMSRVVEAAVKNRVAIEINNRYSIPSAAFVRLAKQAGAKFTFGTNNSDGNLGRMEYALKIVRECDLKWQDILVPSGGGNRSTRTTKSWSG